MTWMNEHAVAWTCLLRAMLTNACTVCFASKQTLSRDVLKECGHRYLGGVSIMSCLLQHWHACFSNDNSALWVVMTALALCFDCQGLATRWFRSLKTPNIMPCYRLSWRCCYSDIGYWQRDWHMLRWVCGALNFERLSFFCLPVDIVVMWLPYVH